MKGRHSFKFAHDRIQQAAYSLIDPGQRREIHLDIGKLLLASTPRKSLEENIFDIVNQLNHGIALISEESERIAQAELNLLAGRKSRAAMAYEPALGWESLPKSWAMCSKDTTLADALARLAENFEYDGILACIRNMEK